MLGIQENNNNTQLPLQNSLKSSLKLAMLYYQVWWFYSFNNMKNALGMDLYFIYNIKEL